MYLLHLSAIKRLNYVAHISFFLIIVCFIILKVHLFIKKLFIE